MSQMSHSKKNITVHYKRDGMLQMLHYKKGEFLLQRTIECNRIVLVDLSKLVKTKLTKPYKTLQYDIPG